MMSAGRWPPEAQNWLTYSPQPQPYSPQARPYTPPGQPWTVIQGSHPNDERANVPSTISSPTSGPWDEQTAMTQWHTCTVGCDGFDCEFNSNEKLPFEDKDYIAHGRSGAVYSVRSTVTKTSFAIKEMIWRRSESDKIREEIRIHRSLQHRHITSIVGTYLQTKNGTRFFGVVMEPLARCDLSTYLDEISRRRASRPNSEQLARDSSVLLDSFGCLASGLAYLHGKNVKHKDIKPENILLYKGTLLLTDFGVSRDFSATGHSMSVGPIEGTMTFVAPEILDDKDRHRSTDIFSLGCVFVEIFVVLNGFSVTRLRDSLRTSKLYGRNISVLTSWAKAISQYVGSWGQRQFVSAVVTSMLFEDESRRPTASEVWASARTMPGIREGDGRALCGVCCMGNTF